ncbi:MAG TPA: hypothetical protein VMJ10_17030 [Kofleriaceae bacterium]|nr:hypothetical protein [Kofleriaceae bacterium]
MIEEVLPGQRLVSLGVPPRDVEPTIREPLEQRASLRGVKPMAVIEHDERSNIEEMSVDEELRCGQQSQRVEIVVSAILVLPLDGEERVEHLEHLLLGRSARGIDGRPVETAQPPRGLLDSGIRILRPNNDSPDVLRVRVLAEHECGSDEREHDADVQ